jgi:hypothetical protein
MRPGVLLVAALSVAALAAATGCRREGCVGGDDGRCLPPAACGALPATTCDGAAKLRFAPVKDASSRAPGAKALAATDDLVLENDRVRAVLDLPEHPHGLAPTGGTIIDLSPIDADGNPVGDQLNGIYQGAGLLPRDAVHYSTWTVINQSVAQTSDSAYVAVVFRGHLEGDPRVTVVTRYELRACEAGLRVRTDIYNGARDPNTLALTDAFFWGDRTLLPFVPLPGQGFRMPKLDLLNIDDAWREWPFMAARTQAAPEIAYAVVPCDRAQSAGFNATTLSASGVPLVTTLPGDGFSHERFILAVPGPGVAPAVDEALRVRAAVHGDAPAVTVSGRVVTTAGALDGEGARAASLVFYEPASGADVDPDDETRTIPRTEVVPDAKGLFHVDLPPNRVYRVQPYAFGLPASAPRSLAVGVGNVDAGDIALERAARLSASVEASPGVPATFAELVLIPVEARAPGAPAPSLYGSFSGCDPMLGPPHGGSPACNRALTINGRFDLLVPPGRYYVYATRGPFASLDRREVALGAGDETAISLLSTQLPGMLPAGTLSGDFHVHGSGSYDSSIPDQDRVVSFLASGVDVVVATDHDVVTTYGETLEALGVGDRLIVIPGVEATPNILWFAVPGQSFPKTLGHFNFWPLTHEPLGPRNGAPWDEQLEPGQLMDAVEPLFDVTGSGMGVRQMNHPWSESKLGRDEGFLRVLGADPRQPFATDAEGSFAGRVLLRRPGTMPGSRRNLDWDVQEVLSGASRRDWLRFRTLWFSMLSQGVLRAGSANSDTHSLALERIGYPRNLVFGGHDRATFDRDRFDADVRQGHMIGTNGPVLDVTIDDKAGELHRPGLEAFEPAAKATLTVAIAAAPWIPVAEVRVYVDGDLRKTVDVSKTFMDRNHFGLAATRERITIPLDETLLRGTGDSWIVVEAGLHQDLPPDDLDGVSDGLPDLPDIELPRRPPNAVEPSMERFDLEAVAPGVWPVAFTNPFLLDRNGGGWTAPGLPK